MTAKVGQSIVSYGIGVQNRYSAFLEDEDGFILSNTIKRPTDDNSATNKHKGTREVSKANNAKNNARTEPPSASMNKKQDAQPKPVWTQTSGLSGKNEVRRQNRDGKSQQPVATGNQTSKNFVNKNRNFNQDAIVATNGGQKFPRNQSQGVVNQRQHDNVPYHQNNQENHNNQNGRPIKTFSPRSNQRPRYQGDDKRIGQQHDGTQLNGHLASNDEEKARRQQKRLTNLRFKDPEKIRDRRNQTVSSSEQQSTPKEQVDEISADQRDQKNKRDGDKNKVRSRRANQNGETNREPIRRDVRRDRPQRQKNGFEGSQSETGNKQDKQKPIPNFSDKADFPCLAS